MSAPGLCWWLEVGPLKEGNYTGISQVTAALANAMLHDTARDCRFFFGRAVVEADVVADAVARRNGELLDWYMARAGRVAAPDTTGARNVAIFPNRKTCRGGFDCEVQIIHDLSTLLTPEFHGTETVQYHALTLLEDVASNDLTVCVSDTTRTDVLRYLGPLDAARVVRVYLGAEQAHAVPGAAVEPYALVLGTIEPRKNIGQVLAFLAEQPQVLRALRFVFLGRYGWGESVEALLERYGLEGAYKAGRIVFPGYVSDTAKQALLCHARLMIYPSLFEGFGLPVLEALAVGTPCLATGLSSLREVGGAYCCYFDPFIAGDFARGFAAALQDGGAGRAGRMEWARQFTWERTWRDLTGVVEAYWAKGHAEQDGHAG